MARTAGRTRLEGVVTTIAALAGGLVVWGLFGFVGRLPWSAGREADWWLECRRSPCWTGPSGGWLSGDGSAGLFGSGCAEIPEGSGRENSEDCFVGWGCDENCWRLPPPPALSGSWNCSVGLVDSGCLEIPWDIGRERREYAGAGWAGDPDCSARPPPPCHIARGITLVC